MRWWPLRKSKSKKAEPSSGRVRQSVNDNERVKSYYTASKKQLDEFDRSARLQQETPSKKISIKNILKFALFAAVFSIVLYGVVVLYGEPRVELSGGEPYRSIQEYQDVVASAVDESVANKFKPSLKTEEIAKTVKQALPESILVDVTARIFGGSPEAAIVISPAFAVFNQSGLDSIILSNRGRLAVDVKNTTLPVESLSTIDNQSGYIYKVGDQVFKPSEMEALVELQHQFNVAGETSVKYILPEKPREIWVVYKDYKILFSLDVGAPITTQFGAFKAIKLEIEQGRQAPPKEYIDVRLGDRVFIK